MSGQPLHQCNHPSPIKACPSIYQWHCHCTTTAWHHQAQLPNTKQDPTHEAFGVPRTKTLGTRTTKSFTHDQSILLDPYPQPHPQPRKDLTQREYDHISVSQEYLHNTVWIMIMFDSISDIDNVNVNCGCGCESITISLSCRQRFVFASGFDSGFSGCLKTPPSRSSSAHWTPMICYAFVTDGKERSFRDYNWVVSPWIASLFSPFNPNAVQGSTLLLLLFRLSLTWPLASRRFAIRNVGSFQIGSSCSHYSKLRAIRTRQLLA
jgi:hypothetical protein